MEKYRRSLQGTRAAHNRYLWRMLDILSMIYAMLVWGFVVGFTVYEFVPSEYYGPVVFSCLLLLALYIVYKLGRVR